jgi:hypothetical protein
LTPSGYTGLYATEYMAEALPTDLSWAIAGRSREKLEKIAADLKTLNPDRRQPGMHAAPSPARSQPPGETRVLTL